MPKRLSLAVDVEGGDCEISVLVDAIIGAALKVKKPLEIIFCGDRSDLQKLIDPRIGICTDLTLKIEHSPDKILQSDKPSLVWKNRSKSSLVRAVTLQKEGNAQVTLSAGDTRILMSSAIFILGLKDKIRRPALAAFLPTASKTEVLLLDIGANLECKAEQLVDFGLLGSEHFASRFNKSKPRVALLNVGEESSKGTKPIIEAGDVLSKKCSRYVGYIEGGQILSGDVDVVVCDGFVGNTLLKSFESFYMLAKSIAKDQPEIVNGLFKKMTILNRDNYGAAPLLGLNGTVYKAHGASSAKAIENAALVAIQAGFSTLDINEIEKQGEI